MVVLVEFVLLLRLRLEMVLEEDQVLVQQVSPVLDLESIVSLDLNFLLT